MSIKFFNQWLQCFSGDPFSWTDFDVITICFEKDEVGKDWSADIALLGLGFHFHYVTKAGQEYWSDVVEGIREREAMNKGTNDDQL